MEFNITEQSYIFRFLDYMFGYQLTDAVKKIRTTVTEWNEGGGSILEKGLEDEFVTVKLYSAPPNGDVFSEESFVKELTFKGDTNGADYRSATNGYYTKYSSCTIGDGFEIFKRFKNPQLTFHAYRRYKLFVFKLRLFDS